MNDEGRFKLSPGAAAAAALAMLFVGAGGTYFMMRDRGAVAPQNTPAVTPGSAVPDIVVTMTKDAVDRAGIIVMPVSTQSATDSLRLPGVVEPNAYRQVSVTPLVAGRVVSVSAQLGDRVRKGQAIAQVYSPELAEARTKYVAARAMLAAHDRELQRTQKLVDIGAASRQELERLHAEHAAQTAEVESARARLRLLGAQVDETSSSIAEGGNATISVPAPIAGVITERLANAGSIVDSTTKLFTIVDLSNVWIVADVYERDLHRVRESVDATVTTTAYPDQTLEGRVTYIDPQLNASTRTAKIRIEVANPRGHLRLGMYADVSIGFASSTPVLAVPKDAVQNVGDRQVVYLSQSNDGAKFVEREVRLGRVMGDQIEVLSGLAAGDSVVAKGSFFVRAEAERLGLRRSQRSAAEGQPLKIAVTEKGYEPDRLTVRAGVPVRLIFVRTTDKTCGTEVAFPSLNIKRALPLNEPVPIDFTPANAGVVAFVCGMNMLKGAVVVE